MTSSFDVGEYIARTFFRADLAAAICRDRTVVADAEKLLRDGRRVALGPDCAAALDPALLTSGDWLPLLPLSHGGDVTAGCAELRDPRLGEIVEVTVDVAVGASSWDPEPMEWFAESNSEALLWGLDAVDTLVRTQPAAGALDVADRRSDVIRLSGCCTATVRATRADLLPSPIFAIAVRCRGGAIHLRMPFAPGNVTVWLGSVPGFRSYTAPHVGEVAGNTLSRSGYVRAVLSWLDGAADAGPDAEADRHRFWTLRTLLEPGQGGHHGA